jgi:hypothetical protein
MKKLLFLGIVLLTSCSKNDTNCRFYTKGDLKLVQKTGQCYYLDKGKRVYLDKEKCANYCD